MVWLRPWWLLALIPLAWLLWRLWRSRPEGDAGPWSRLVDPHLLPHLLVGDPRPIPRWPLFLLGIGWLLLVIALAGPAWRTLPQPVYGLSGRTLILIDLSPSMDAADISPSRLGRARFEAMDLLKATQGQVGLLAFGPEPFLVSPLTTDAKIILPQVNLLTSDLIPFPGPRRTDRALAEARALLERTPGGAAQVVLISDGVGEFAGALQEARRLADAGHRLAVLGMGTVEGAPVPLAGGGFEQGPDGSPRLAQLERERLQALARAGQGIYVESVPEDSDTQRLIAAAPKPDRGLVEAGLKADRWHEEGPWLILVLLPLAALAFRRGWLVSSGGHKALFCALGLMGASLAFGGAGVAEVWAQVVPDPAKQQVAWEPPSWRSLWLRPDQQAARDLASGQTVDVGRLSDPAWRATARYRAGDHAGALAELKGLEGPEIDYNRGVALARLGRFAEAAAAFAAVLEQDPGHADARHNLELMRRLLANQDRQSGLPAGEGKPNRSQAGSSGQREAGPLGQQEGQGSSQGRSPGPQDLADQSGVEQGAAVDGHLETDGASDLGMTDPSSRQADRPDTPSKARAESSAEGSDNGHQEGAGSDRGQAHAVYAAGIARDQLPEPDERAQSLEMRLRAVPDDPAGLLRQRFFLQHLRRKEEGR